MPLRGKGKSGRQNIKSFLNPNAPTIGTATNAGSGRAYNNGSATLTFTASASGAAATSFTATSSPGSYTVTGASSPLTITGLQSNTAYTFVVKATNAVGDSSDSSASNSITATTVPQAPTIGSASSTGTSTATVTYTAGATGGAAVSAYTVSPGSGSGASPISISGLSGGTSYTFTVTATNANGTSAASSGSNSITTTQLGRKISTVSIESVYGAGNRSSSYTMSYSTDNSNWTQAFSGTMANNGACGNQACSGGGGDYGRYRYWKLTKGFLPRVAYISVGFYDGGGATFVYFNGANCSDSGNIDTGPFYYDSGG